MSIKNKFLSMEKLSARYSSALCSLMLTPSGEQFLKRKVSNNDKN